MDKRILTWMALVFWALLCVSLDLYTTGIGLALGAHELNPWGNKPYLEFGVAYFATSGNFLVQLYARRSGVKLLSIGSQLITVAVAALPLVAVANNLMVIAWLS